MGQYAIIKNGTKQKISGGGGGHTIQNPSGTDMSQEPTMQFKDAHITDDALNEKTKVEVVKEVTYAQFQNLPTDGSADGVYIFGDGQGGSGIDADDVTFDNTGTGMSSTNTGNAIRELNAEIVVYQKTLTAGSTTITYTSDTIDGNACFDWYAEDGVLAPTSWSVSSNTLTATYTAQASDIVVGVQILRGKAVV